jgi:ribosome-binding factor A
MERMIRVNALLKRELGVVFERLICSEFECLITVTDVETSPDLHEGTVYVSVYGSEQQQQDVMRSLRKRRGEIQRHVSKSITLKYMPVLRFKLDGQAARADSLMRILREIEGEDG